MLILKQFFRAFLLLGLASADDSSSNYSMLSPQDMTGLRPVVIGQTFLAGSMDPTDGSTGWSLTSHGVSEKLFTVNQEGEIVPQVAESVTKIDENTWELTLKSDYMFSDGTVADAQHVADALQDLNTSNESAQASLGNITVTALGNSTVRIETERPTHVMDAVLAEWVFTVFKKDAEGNFLFTGPYAIEVCADLYNDYALHRIDPLSH